MPYTPQYEMKHEHSNPTPFTNNHHFVKFVPVTYNEGLSGWSSGIHYAANNPNLVEAIRPGWRAPEDLHTAQCWSPELGQYPARREVVFP